MVLKSNRSRVARYLLLLLSLHEKKNQLAPSRTRIHLPTRAPEGGNYMIILWIMFLVSPFLISMKYRPQFLRRVGISLCPLHPPKKDGKVRGMPLFCSEEPN
ncbi:uncharacterized protein LOC126797710 [Argentina anserina]|uniref:uncharacterized protein LOC126797710 n=1 Tax=Argentina anserina TaxID=57926 RepID=UPI00217665C1|nr:uncharacterized protein LOC126797710 [Potentilla anserina]